MKKIVYIMRGLQGSGKSTLAKKIASKSLDSVVCSADDYFYKDGKYEWKASEMKEAHEYCFNKFKTALDQESPIVVIDNTNIKWKHFRPYIQYVWDYHNNNNIYNVRAIDFKYQYKVKLIEPKTWWKFNPYQLYKKNTHGVPIETIERNIKNWDNIIYFNRKKWGFMGFYQVFIPQRLPRRLCTLIQRVLNFLN